MQTRLTVLGIHSDACVQVIRQRFLATKESAMSNPIPAADFLQTASLPALGRTARGGGTDLQLLAASIAHELKQPLAGILTNANLCRRLLDSATPDLDGARATLRRTIRDVKRAVEMIDRLRGLFANQAPASESVDLNDTVLSALALSRTEIERAGISVRCDLDDDLSGLVGDGIQVHQVVSNLIRNAIDAMRGVHDRDLALTITTERSGDDQVTLRVCDVGSGVAHGDVDRLFDPFYKTKPDGMGVGLCISRAIVERHGGRLWATRNDGPGTSFWLSLPVTRRGRVSAQAPTGAVAPSDVTALPSTRVDLASCLRDRMN
jgi:signal transduction histidine kinase